MYLDDNPDVKIRQIFSVDDPAVPAAIRIYQDSFAGPPYFEKFTDEEIYQDIIVTHVKHYLAVAEVDGQPIGVICARATISPESEDIREYLEKHRHEVPFDLKDSCYISEAAVSGTVRKRGTGNFLLQATINWARSAGYKYYLARTAAEGSNSVRILERAGARRLPFVQDVSKGPTKSNSSHRVWLYGETAPAAGQ